MKWKYVSYSVSIGIAVTALSFLLYKEGGELVLWPGITMELMINSLTLLIIHSDDWYSLPSGTYLVLNTAFYSFVVLIILLVITRLGFLQRRPKPNRFGSAKLADADLAGIDLSKTDLRSKQ